MPAKAPPDLPGADALNAFKQWKPEAQQRALALLREHENATWRPFFCPDLGCDGNPHGTWDFQHARANQRPPRWSREWLTWLLSGGRGSGKTRPGSEVTHRVIEHVERVALIAATGPDLRETVVEGVSGLLATAPPGKRPLWEPSKKKLTWPNGAIAQGFSAEEPDRLRGPQFGFAWADEPTYYPNADEVWDNMLLGLRMGQHPHAIATCTPKPIKWHKELVKSTDTVRTRMSTYENLVNLAPPFAERILARYEGTRLGRQELHGEDLDDVEGALWTWDMFQWVPEPPPLVRIVSGVDPAGTANKKSDETGIIVAGISATKDLYVLHDASGKYSPAVWGKKANDSLDDFSGDCIAAEKNYGGDMVRYVLTNAGHKGARIKLVDSRRGKAIRAEPVVALYEKNRVFHVGRQGDLAELEDELTTWIPGEGDSPNRLDALVHCLTELVGRSEPSHIASPTGLPGRHLRAV
jgi:phage terminase large subunit-like protein